LAKHNAGTMGKIGRKTMMIIEGKDWSSSKDVSSLKVNSCVEFESSEENEQKIQINPYEYFEYYKSLYGVSDCISPINLGVYRDMADYLFHSTQFVGIMPMVKLKTLKPLVLDDKEVCEIRIDSRFHISPSEMLQYVLDGDDYYENPEMLQFNSYRLTEVRELFGRGKKNRVLCGTIKDIGKVNLQQAIKADCGRTTLDPVLSSAYPIFEIIRFVNLAKDVCKKNLKKLSVYKEENLVGKVKGRILINKQIKQNLSKGQYQKTYCAFNALSEDIKENIIIKYTLYLCSKLSVSDSLKEDIMFCNRVLGDVPLKKCSVSDFVGIKSNGAFRQYKQVLEAAKVLIKRYYISYENASNKQEGNKNGKIQVADYMIEPYFIDMNLLFEYYCRALFRNAIKKLNSESDVYVLQMDSAMRGNIALFDNADNKEKIGTFYMGNYKPDIVVRYKEKSSKEETILTVIDAKYSDMEHSGEKRARTHQILFYMNVLNCTNGGLISPYMGSERDVIKSSFIYDGSKNKKSKQKLCYIPLYKEDSSIEKEKLSERFSEMIKGYLISCLPLPIIEDNEKYKKELMGRIRE